MAWTPANSNDPNSATTTARGARGWPGPVQAQPADQTDQRDQTASGAEAAAVKPLSLVPALSTAPALAAVPPPSRVPALSAVPTAGTAQGSTPTSARPSLAKIIEEQEEIFIQRQPESARLAELAGKSLAGGVVSSWQISRPQPVWLSHGKGSKLYDVDGNQYVDLHGGYGVSLAGHSHPAIVEAVQAQVKRGTHFAQPTETALAVASELSQRFGLPQWRFANSGTEATMDAVHLMRAITGRDKIIKVEGCYHGHHDSVQVSVCPDDSEDDLGPAGRPNGVPSSSGIPQAITDLTLIVGFNDLDAVRRRLAENPGEIAGMILEPIMMNAGIIKPDPGYLAGLKELLGAHGALLTFDEVKTGLTAGPGGATGVTGVAPDIVCLAKAIGGGIAVAAVGGTAEVMSHVANGDYEMVGTFNGNPLAMAAAKAMLTEVATPDSYRRLEKLRLRAVDGLESEITRNGLNAQVVSVGAKGCVVFSSEPVRNFRDFLNVRDSFSHAHWLFQHNGGVFLPPWGKIEQWLMSVQHDEADIDRFIENFATFAAAVRP
jgi:glutamate-1-semialdehyde 2,1-aminomutase